VITRYADPALRGSNRFVLTGFPATFVDASPVVKIKFHLNVHGLVTIARATLMEVEPEAAPEAQPDPAAMDTTADGQPKKKQYKRTELTVETQTSAMDKKAVTKAF